MRIDNNNFAVTYEKYKNTVYSVIFSYVRNKEDSLDLMQETFIRLLKADSEFESDEHVKAWLIRVASNLSKNLLRDNNRYSDEEIPEQPYYDEHKDDTVLQKVMQLPEKYRIPIHLFYYEDYSVQQIAKVLDMREGTVKVNLKRGRDKLKEMLNGEDFI
ncbi:MAG: sigma-70 family RNA polymerase sigma factor [Saccharofermentans sp.]|nr:sigma-70 family RNA polymerase sigma factor [Saccharofermentans sp.]